MTDNLYTREESRDKLMNGIRKASRAVGATMGTAGGNSLLEALERPHFYSTNDGFSILNSIRFADPIEELGRKILCESVNRANKSSGDGSSTTCVLTAAILEEGAKHIGEVSPMELKRSLEACIPLVEASIKAQTKEIDVDSVEQVASISAEDEGIGAIIQEIYQKIGKEGIINWDISKTPEDSYTLGTGLTINGATYVAPYMCDDGTQEVRLKNPRILLARKKITTALEFEKLFAALFAKEVKEIVVFCDEIEVQVIADLYKTQRIRGFKTVVVKMPKLWNDEWWEDLALATGAKTIDILSGIKLDEATIEHLGTVENLRVTKEDTFIDGTKDLSEHIAKLQNEGTDQALVRAARLNAKTARYFVGAHSESALAYRRLKVEDALNAAACALEHGVVVGGGVALINTSKDLPHTVGGLVLFMALKSPYKTIASNAGEEEMEGSGTIGLDTRTREMVDMFEAGIIDPSDVVLNAVRSAIGVAASILTTKNVVLLPKEEPSGIIPAR